MHKELRDVHDGIRLEAMNMFPGRAPNDPSHVDLRRLGYEGSEPTIDSISYDT